MIVISDTTPIITLLKIERLDLLKEMYGSVKIPFAVYSELTTNSDFLEESEKIKNYVEIIKNSGRHISKQLLDKLLEL